MSLASGRDPLIDIGMSYLQADATVKLTNEILDSARETLAKFLCGDIAHSVARAEMQALVGSPKSIDNLYEIITVPDQPIPRCFSRPNNPDRPSERRRVRSWTKEEDTRLLAGIHRFGLERWVVVAQFVGSGRGRSECAQRWLRVLDPKICRGPWTKADEDRLCRLVKQFGEHSWMRVAQEMGNHADVQCRYHFFQMQRRPVYQDSNTPASSGPMLTPDSVEREAPIGDSGGKEAEESDPWDAPDSWSF
jgi:hypothetical protein